jgi:hypothetical protein
LPSKSRIKLLAALGEGSTDASGEVVEEEPQILYSFIEKPEFSLRFK